MTDETLAAMIEQIGDSAVFMHLYHPATPEEIDPTQALQLGAALLMGKPIILAIQPGHVAPPALRRIADEIIEIDLEGHPEDTAIAVKAALERLTK